MSGYPRKRAQTRQRLLRAGMVVVARNGPDGARVRDVAAEAGVVTGTFYNHFPSLAELIDAIAGELSVGVEIASTTLEAIEHDPAARVAIGTCQLMQLVDDDPTSASAFIALLAGQPSFRSRIRSVITGAVADGVRTGRFAVVDAATVSDACLGAAVQWMRSALAGEADAEAGVAAGDAVRARLRVMLAIVGLDQSDVDQVIDMALSARL
ncbi:MAG: TetR/AcrR family transcriptional regulator [Actinomycetota bacterium]